MFLTSQEFLQSAYTVIQNSQKVDKLIVSLTPSQRSIKYFYKAISPGVKRKNCEADPSPHLMPRTRRPILLRNVEIISSARHNFTLKFSEANSGGNSVV
jgi:hypothetical protein